MKETVPKIGISSRRSRPRVKSGFQNDRSEIERLKTLYQTIFSESSIGYAVVDMKGVFLDYNPCFREMVGFTDDELRTMTYRDLTPEKWRVLEEQIINEFIMTRGRSHTYEKEYRRKDGTIFPVELNGFSIKDEHGNPACMWALVKDITERRRSEERLRESEERYRTVLDHIEEGYFEIDMNGDLVFFNQVLEKIIGYEKNELLSMEHHFYLDHENAAEMRRVCKTILSTGNSVQNHNSVITRKDGDKRNLAISISLKRDRNGKPSGYRGTVRDVTGLKKIEGALKVSEQRRLRFVENIDLGVCWISPDYKVQFINKAQVKISQQNCDDIIGQECFRALGKRKRICPHCPGRVAMKEGRKAEIEAVHIRDDGSRLDVRLIAYPVFNSEGRLNGFIKIMEDITSRKKQDKKIQENEKKYRQLFEILQEGIWVIDQNASTAIVNPRMAEMLGYRPEEMIGKSLYDFMEQSFRGTSRKYFQRRMEGIVDQYDFEFIRKDGKPIYTSLAVAPVLDGKGNFRGAIAGVMDITERKKAEDEVRNSEERFSKAFINIPVPTIITDLKSNFIIDGSESWFRLSGYSRDESVGRSTIDLGIWVEPALRERLVQKLMKERSLCEEPMQVRTKSGEIKDLLWSAELLTINNDEVILSLLNDVTERNRTAHEKTLLESQLQQAQKMESLGTLAGGIAHDFNNILGSIIGYTEMTLQRDIPEESRGRRNLEQVLKAGSRAKDLVNQILAFSRRQAPERRPLQVVPVIKDALKLMRASLPATIEIKKNVTAQTDCVLGDPVQFHQIIMNLCTNAARAMKKAGGVLEIGIENMNLDEKAAGRMALKPGLYLQISVSDTGSGISPEILPRIFEPFFSTAKNNEGTGLGLSVVYGIVHACGGAVTVESQPGKGSKFVTFFPIIEKPQRIAQEFLPGDPDLPRGTETILCIDDEPALANLGKDMLGELGYQVISATSSSEALEIFKNRHASIDLVITDYTMPGMTGADLTRSILKIRPETPVILTTGYSETLTREKARAIGIREIVRKPVFIRDLARTIRAVLDNNFQKVVNA